MTPMSHLPWESWVLEERKVRPERREDWFEERLDLDVPTAVYG